MIINKSNEKIKYIASLKEKKYREKYGMYLVEGVKLVDEIISSEVKTTEFIAISKEILENVYGGRQILRKIENFENVIEVSRSVFEYISDTETPQGIMAGMKIKENNINTLEASMYNPKNRFVILDKISDAGNMGTIIRSAVSFGINNIICLVGTVDVYMPKVVRSTMGALEKINIWYFTEDELKGVIETLKTNNYKIVGTDLVAKLYLNDYNVNRKTVYVMGSESKGMSESIKDMCDLCIKIPMENVQESLNVGVATGILFYDAYVRGE